MNLIKSQNGNAFIFILLGVVLFAALAYTFSRGASNQGTSNAERQRQTLNQVESQSCTIWVNKAVDKLKLRGCATSQISYELADGTNANPDAPGDESCHVFRSAGGGATECGAYLEPTSCDLTTLALGEKCPTDDIIFAGTDAGSNRLYTTAADQSSNAVWSQGNFSTAGTASTTNGSANTDTLVSLADASAPYEAANLCRALGADWYLPALDELAVLYANKTSIGGFDETGIFPTGYYLASTEVSQDHHWVIQFSGGTPANNASKGTTFSLRCIRKD